MGLFRRKKVAIENITAGGNGYGQPVHIVYEARPLTAGQGANVMAYDTLALPMYTPIGWGVQPNRQLKVTQGGVQFSRQGITLQTLGDPGNLTGMFVTQPLLDTSNNGTSVPIPSTPNNLLPASAQS